MQNSLKVVLCAVIWLLIPASGTVTPLSAAQQTADQKASQNDSYQRSTNMYTYNVRAKNGPARGEEIYYYKCWFCHNQYVKIGPQLGELYKRGTFVSSGDEVTDRNVAAKIQEGGPGMPSFRTTMKDPDIADLVSYIKSEKCCFNSQDPPPNARYRGGKQ